MSDTSNHADALAERLRAPRADSDDPKDRITAFREEKKQPTIAKPTVDLTSDEVQRLIQAEAAKHESVQKYAKRLDEFRATEVELRKQLDGWNELGVSREEVASVIGKVRKDEEGRLVANGNLESVLRRREADLRERYAREVQAKEAELSNLNAQADEAMRERSALVVSREVQKSLQHRSPHPQAIGFIEDLAKDAFEYTHDGGLSPKPGTSARNIDEWLEQLTRDRPFFFLRGSGDPVRSKANGSVPKGLQARDKLEWARTQGLKR